MYRKLTENSAIYPYRVKVRVFIDFIIRCLGLTLGLGFRVRDKSYGPYTVYR